MEIATEMDLELQSHLLTDLCMNLYRLEYINGHGAPEPLMDRCSYEFCIDFNTEMDLELQSLLWKDLCMNLF